MKITNLKKIPPKDLIVFDLDGTIVRTKTIMDPEMSRLMGRLLSQTRVAVIGGGKYEVFQELFLSKLKCPPASLKNLFIFPTTSSAFYRYNSGWKKVYSHELSPKQIQQIKRAFTEAFAEIGYKHPKTVYGEILENRKTQVTFSVYGQDIVKALGDKGVKMKEDWLRDNLNTKMKIAKLVAKKLPQMSVKAAGFTSIDVTKKGIDKAYGMRQIRKQLEVPLKKMIFIGDAIFPGGNDYAAITTGVDYIRVKGPADTKKIIKQLLK